MPHASAAAFFQSIYMIIIMMKLAFYSSCWKLNVLDLCLPMSSGWLAGTTSENSWQVRQVQELMLIGVTISANPMETHLHYTIKVLCTKRAIIFRREIK